MTSTRIIDPTKLSPEDSKLLLQVLTEVKPLTYIQADKGFRIQVTLPNSYVKEWMEIRLTHNILARPCEKNSNETRFEVIGAELGTGTYGVVREIVCTLEPLFDGTLWTKVHNERAIKLMRLPLDMAHEAQEESERTKQSGEFKCKPSVIYAYSHEAVIACNVMQRLNGKTMFDLIDGDVTNNPLSFEQRAFFTLAAIAALIRIHNRDIVHRDLSDSNIYVDILSGELKIFDYGLSKMRSVGDTGTSVGTPLFSPLESFLGLGTCPKSDTYSLAMIIALLWHATPVTVKPTAISYYHILDYNFDGLAHDLPLNTNQVVDLQEVLTKMTLSSRQTFTTQMDKQPTGVDIQFISAVNYLKNQRLDLIEAASKIKTILLEHYLTTYPALTNDIQIAYKEAEKLLKSNPTSLQEWKTLVNQALEKFKDDKNVLTAFTLFLGVYALQQCKSRKGINAAINHIENINNVNKECIGSLIQNIEVKLKSANHQIQRQLLQDMLKDALKVQQKYRNIISVPEIMATEKWIKAKLQNMEKKLKYIQQNYHEKPSNDSILNIKNTGPQ